MMYSLYSSQEQVKNRFNLHRHSMPLADLFATYKFLNAHSKLVTKFSLTGDSGVTVQSLNDLAGDVFKQCSACWQTSFARTCEAAQAADEKAMAAIVSCSWSCV